MHRSIVLKGSAKERTVEICENDYAALLRCVELFAEINAVIGDLDYESFLLDRVRALAVLQLLSTFVANLKQSRRATKTVLKQIPWDEILVIRNRLHALKLDDTTWCEVWHVARGILPELTQLIEDVVSRKQRRRLTVVQDDPKELVTLLVPEESGSRRLLLPKPFSELGAKVSKFNRFSMHGHLNSPDPAFEMLRTQLEIWFRNLPPNDQPDIAKRLRSSDEILHTGAFYELLFHEYFRRRGIEVEREPYLGIPSRPDYKVGYPGCPFLLEITTAWTTVDDQIIFNDQKMFLNCLDKMPNQFLLSVDFDDWSLPFGLDNFRDAVEEWLATVEPGMTARRSFLSNAYCASKLIFISPPPT